MAWEARSGLKPEHNLHKTQEVHGLNGLGSPFGIVRHVTHHRIPGTARRNEEKGSWVIQSTWRRKTKGKAAYWKSHRDLTDERGRGWQDPCGMNKARLPEAQLTVVAQRDLWESVWSPDPSLRWSSIPTVALS